MKAIIKTITVISLNLLAISSVIGQGSLISLDLIPQNPTQQDIVQVDYYVGFNNNASKTNHTVEIQGNKIYVTLKYNVGAASVITYCRDTIAIGKLPVGPYRIITNFKTYHDDIVFNKDTTYFTVGSVHTEEIQQENSLNLYPNPTNDYVNISFLNESYNLIIYDILGREMERIDKNEINNNLKINVLSYPKGMYLFVFEQNGKKVLRKLIKE